jgi:hypothetical protein
MDSQGNIYRPGEERPGDAVELPDDSLATVEGFNRAQRRVYYAERRRGTDEQEAIRIARESLPR